MDATIELNLKELFAAIVRKLWLIVLCAILSAAVALVYTAKFVTPLYKTSITVYVNNTIYGEKEGISSGDLTTSQKLVNTYMQVIKSETFLEKVCNSVDNKITTDMITSGMTLKSVSSTEIFSVTISNSDPQLAAEVANAIAQLVPVEVPEIADGSSARIIDYAKVPTAPYSPSYAKNVTLGACIGALLVLIILVIQVLMDLHIKGEEDLKLYSDAPVLGYIPHYDAVGQPTGYEYESPVKEDDTDDRAVNV